MDPCATLPTYEATVTTGVTNHFFMGNTSGTKKLTKPMAAASEALAGKTLQLPFCGVDMMHIHIPKPTKEHTP